jgi:hypothetical protein
MMEQLAERRMQREEDAERQFSNPGYAHPPSGVFPSHHSHAGHNHPPPQEDEEYDDEDEEDDEYDSQDDDYDDEEMVILTDGERVSFADEKQDTMTEEQRMEEGRRMFQIFAARMFEQRVLTAYKEKVAKERQQKLIEELEAEDAAETQRKLKKAKDAQKKKDKLAQKKQAQAEEKARREAEKAAEEAARREVEEKKAEEQRLRAEERRKKREAQKKADEEERQRKEAEKQKRLQEQRERQAELERKQREAKDRERREREETKQKALEAKEAKEREARERKERQEREKKEHEAKVKAEKEASEQRRREDQAAQQAAAHVAQTAAQQGSRRPQLPISIPIPPGLQALQSPVFSSPHVPVATPVMPMVPTPLRSRKTSQIDAAGSNPQTPQAAGKSQNPSPNPSTPHQESPGPIGPPGRSTSQTPFLHHPQASSPMHAALKGPPGLLHTGPFAGNHSAGMNGFAPSLPMMNTGFPGRLQHEPMFGQQPFMGNQFRPMGAPAGMPGYPGMNTLPGMQGRGFPLPHGPPGFSHQPSMGPLSGQFGALKDPNTSNSHSRHQSASLDKGAFDIVPSTPAAPIARPAPIGRPSSVVQDQRRGEHGQPGNNELEDLSNHLGSSALLDDSDEAVTSIPGTRRASAAPGLSRQGFGPAVPFGIDPSSAFGSPINSYSTWGAPSTPFGASSLPGTWSSASPVGMGGWPHTNGAAFGSLSGPSGRPGQPRSVAVRLMLCRACKNLEGNTQDTFHSIDDIRDQVERLLPLRDEMVSERELLDICETEGNSTNGGGTFEVKAENGTTMIRYEVSTLSSGRPAGVPGEIGSPIVGSGMPAISRFTSPPGIPAPGGY